VAGAAVPKHVAARGLRGVDGAHYIHVTLEQLGRDVVAAAVADRNMDLGDAGRFPSVLLGVRVVAADDVSEL
jgi:hypothetical protein